MPDRLSVVVVAAAVVVLALSGCSGPTSQRIDWEVLGTSAEAEVVAHGASNTADMLLEIRDRSLAAGVELDPYSTTGALGRLNRTAVDSFYTVEQIDLYACLRLALDYAKVSGGAYDPSAGAMSELYTRRIESANLPRPAEIEAVRDRVGWEKVTVEPEAHAVRFRAAGLVLDFGPVARGCAVDWAVRTFARPGAVAGLVRMGGVFRAWRSPPGRSDWEIRLDDPRAPDRELAAIRVVNRGVAVCGQPEAFEGSGQAELRRLPVIDPRTGQPATSDLLAVITTADSAADAAALCRAIYVGGALSGTDVFREMRRVEAVFVVRGDAGPPYVLASASLRGRLELSESLRAEIGDDVRYLLPPETM